MKFFEKKLLKLSDSERNLMGMLIAEARRCIKTPLDDPYTEKMEKKEDFLFGSQQLIRIYLEQMLIYMIRRNSSPPMTVPVSQFVNLKNNSAVYKRVIAYMEDHIRENITLCDLCHDNMIGRSQLQKIFQEQHQCGAMDFFPVKDRLCQTADPREPDELYADFRISGILFHPLLFQTV